MSRPTLVIVSGPPGGAGKTTLAHRLAPLLGCPAVCRDEIKEGMVHATPGYVPRPGDDLTMRTLATFFGTLDVLLRAGVTTVAEAAFQDHVWRPRLLPLIDLADIRIVHCAADPAAARARAHRRDSRDPRRVAHVATPRSGEAEVHEFVPVALPVPAIHVDTTDGYRPGLNDIVAFLEER